MKHPTDDQRAALVRIGLSKDGQVLSSYLNDILKDSTAKLILDDDPQRVRAYQGECRILRALTEKLNPVTE